MWAERSPRTKPLPAFLGSTLLFQLLDQQPFEIFALDTFSDVTVIKCSHRCLTGTSISQAVDRIVFDKILSILDSILILLNLRILLTYK